MWDNEWEFFWIRSIKHFDNCRYPLILLIVPQFFWIRSIKHFDNCRYHLILLIIPQDFPNGTTITRKESIVGNSRSFSKTSFSTFWMNIYYCYGIFLSNKRGPIKRISLNTRILFVVFNEILISQDSFSRTTVTRQRIRRRRSTFITKKY